MNDANYKSHVTKLEQFFTKRPSIFFVWLLNIVQIYEINPVSAKLLCEKHLTVNISIYILVRNRILNTI